VSYDLIAATMFVSMLLLLGTGQRVFGAIGFVAATAALLLWGDGGSNMPFAGASKLQDWYALTTVPMFVLMGYVLAESGIAGDLYRMFHVWMGGIRGGLAIGTIGLMVLISVINGLSIAGMAIGATIALPELLRRGYDKLMVTGVIQAGSTLGILIPPSVVLVLYAMIARQPVDQLWLAGIMPGLMMATIFTLYIAIRCWFQPHLGPALPKAERNIPMQREAAPAGRRPGAAAGLRGDDRPLRHRHHQPGRELGGGRPVGHPGGRREGQADPGAAPVDLHARPGHHRACSCGSSWPRSASARSSTAWARSRRSSSSSSRISASRPGRC
jgi:TRAP-type mannitol/chloroaromatic compound transport system permease large subunit